MKDVYYYKTIEELEYDIIDKSINLDISHGMNINLFNCFTCIIRTIYIWATFIYTIYLSINKGFKTSIINLLLYIAIYFISTIIISWTKYNCNLEHKKMKLQLIINMVDGCKEFKDNEDKYEEWQIKQMKKRFLSLAHIEDVSSNDI